MRGVSEQNLMCADVLDSFVRRKLPYVATGCREARMLASEKKSMWPHSLSQKENDKLLQCASLYAKDKRIQT